MTRFEFLNTLRTALHGLPADKVEHTVADYERRFEQGIAAGRSESEIARELGDPWEIAARVRVPAHERAANGAAKAGRVFISGIGLAVFNLFMIIPAFIYGVLLMSLYAAALAFYFSGIVMTASSLSGVDEVAFRVPIEQVVIEGPATRRIEGDERVRIAIGDYGIQVQHDDGEVVSIGSVESSDESSSSASTAPTVSGSVVIDHDEDDSVPSTMRGIGVILGGIALLLLCGVLTRYTWIGMKRYVQMNISVLRDA